MRYKLFNKPHSAKRNLEGIHVNINDSSLILFSVCVIKCVESNYFPQFEKNGVNADFRIIGGKPAKLGEFRGQVSVDVE